MQRFITSIEERQTGPERGEFVITYRSSRPCKRPLETISGETIWAPSFEDIEDTEVKRYRDFEERTLLLPVMDFLAERFTSGEPFEE
jgi:hypothetical protein